MATLRESLERWMLAYNDCLELSLCYPSESIPYIGSYTDGYPSGSLLKDGDSPTRTTQC